MLFASRVLTYHSLCARSSQCIKCCPISKNLHPNLRARKYPETAFLAAHAVLNFQFFPLNLKLRDTFRVLFDDLGQPAGSWRMTSTTCPASFASLPGSIYHPNKSDISIRVADRDQ